MEIRVGTTRCVFLIGNYAIKIPVWRKNFFHGKIQPFLKGWLCNRNEYLWSKSRMLACVCPVIHSFLFSLIIVMPRTRELSDAEFCMLDNKEYIIGSIEYKRTSFGWLNNKIVAVDYGD
jgi:hypothetical protein